MKKREKAVSPVVSTVLLIMIVIILAVIILLWANSFVGEAVSKTIQNKTQTVENWCSDLQRDIIAEVSPDETQFGFSNEGNIPIYQYEIITTLKDSGDSNTYLVTPSEGGTVNPGITSLVNSSNPEIGGVYSDFSKIKIIPTLLGEGDRESRCPEKYAITI